MNSCYVIVYRSSPVISANRCEKTNAHFFGVCRYARHEIRQRIDVPHFRKISVAITVTRGLPTMGRSLEETARKDVIFCLKKNDMTF
jgi:hypothetical protein